MECNITNAGNTPAILLETVADSGQAPRCSRTRLGNITTEGRKQLTQGEQYGRNYTAQGVTFGAQKHAAIVSGVEKLWFYGYVKLKDEFKDEHTVRWCLF